MTLNCFIFGCPRPEAKWYHNGSLIQTSNKTNVTDVGGLFDDLSLSILTIRDFSPEDEGNYSCSGTNSEGTAVSQVTRLQLKSEESGSSSDYSSSSSSTYSIIEYIHRSVGLAKT